MKKKYNNLLIIKTLLLYSIIFVAVFLMIIHSLKGKPFKYLDNKDIPKEYITITFNNIDINPIKIEKNTSTYLPSNIEKEGYTFIGWSTSDNIDNIITNNYIFTTDTTLSPIYKTNIEYITISFNIDSLENITIEKGSTITLPSPPTKEGYTFINYTTSSNEVVTNDYVYNENTKLNLNYKKNTISYTNTNNIDSKTIFNTYHAMVVGDSMAEGLSAYGYLNTENVIFHRGRRIDNMEKDMPNVINYNPNYLFLSYGCNDLKMWNGNVTKFISYYKEKINYIKEVLPNTTIIINSVLPVGENAKTKYPAYNYQELFNTELKSLANEYNITFLDNSDILTLKENPYSTDGIHPKAFFFKEWALRMSEYLENN